MKQEYKNLETTGITLKDFEDFIEAIRLKQKPPSPKKPFMWMQGGYTHHAYKGRNAFTFKNDGDYIYVAINNGAGLTFEYTRSKIDYKEFAENKHIKLID